MTDWCLNSSREEKCIRITKNYWGEPTVIKTTSYQLSVYTSSKAIIIKIGKALGPEYYQWNRLQSVCMECIKGGINNYWLVNSVGAIDYQFERKVPYFTASTKNSCSGLKFSNTK